MPHNFEETPSFAMECSAVFGHCISLSAKGVAKVSTYTQPLADGFTLTVALAYLPDEVVSSPQTVLDMAIPTTTSTSRLKRQKTNELVGWFVRIIRLVFYSIILFDSFPKCILLQ